MDTLHRENSHVRILGPAPELQPSLGGTTLDTPLVAAKVNDHSVAASCEGDRPGCEILSGVGKYFRDLHVKNICDNWSV